MINRLFKLAGIIILSFFFLNTNAQKRTSPKNQSEELGKVSWYRDYNTAVSLSKKKNKDILILFQEIPGCSTCRNYGHNVLSNPLLVEVIEQFFIPLAIHNNKRGKDKEILDKFKEPSWNNPVIRVVDYNGRDIVKRVGGNYSALALFKTMENALLLRKKSLPEYMKLLKTELSSTKERNSIKEKYFQMYCFWSGEKHFGATEGIVSTEPGFINNYEVVKVKYNENLINGKQLNSYAKKANFSPIKKNDSYHTAYKDNKYYLQHSNYKYLPLNELQKVKINSALGNRISAKKYLSPKQLLWLKQIENSNTKKQILYSLPFEKAWAIKSKN